MNGEARSVVITTVMFVSLIGLVVSPALAGLAVNFNGYGFFEDGSPAWFDALSITNTRTGVEWNDTYFGIGHPQIALWQNYYVLALDEPTNVITGDVLEYVATNGTGTNISYLTYDPAITGMNPEHDITFQRAPEKPRISVSPAKQNLSIGDSFTINVTMDPAGTEIYGAQFFLDFDQNVLNATAQTSGTFLAQDGTTTIVIINKINNTIGRIEYGETRWGVEDGVTNPGTLASITFKAVGSGTSDLNLNNVMVSDSNISSVATDSSNGKVMVEGPTLFTISGFVTYPNGTPIFNPSITVTNLNTSEILSANTNETSNYYAIATDSNHVNAGAVLQFNASNDNAISFNHSITQAEMTAGGFVQNITIIPLPLPDLIVSDILAPPAFVDVSTNVSVVIKNIGNAAAGRFNVSVDINGSSVDKRALAGLAAGDTTTLTFAWTPSQIGNYEFSGDTDCDNDVTESNETNNGLSKLVTVLTQKPDLIVESLEAYHYQTPRVWFNLSNFVNVSIINEGYASTRFNVTLHVDGLEFKSEVDGLESGARTNVLFNWTPIGEDCMNGGGPKAYALNVSIDSDAEIDETNETNNHATITTTVYWNGYGADEPLDTIAHGTIQGGLYYSTGNSSYVSGGLSSGDSVSARYNLSFPPNATVAFARLYVYYTWASTYPEMQVNVTTPEGTTYQNLPLDKSYNDRKCFPGFNNLWGTYAFNLTPCINGSGTYIVTVRELSSGRPCYAGRGILVVYEDDTMPLREYWINEGADALMGGRRVDGGELSLEECINTASFPGSIDLKNVSTATLAVVSPWSDNPWEEGRNVLYFNGIELGRDVYSGYQPIGDVSLNGIRMTGGGYPQVGVNLSDVASHLTANGNVAGQGDNGDGMMPSNAFLLVEYAEQANVFDTGPGTYPSISGTHRGRLTPGYTIEVTRLYTYSCAGTGGHAESVRIYGNGVDVNATWDGNQGDGHAIQFPHQVTLVANHTYNYILQTDSYPQIIHKQNHTTFDGSIIACEEFIDANGKRYTNWIPAFKLE
ncbi:MAG: DUF3344 domain-containing protein [Methanomicrobia archaeon]|nr:DUF3344 domain-containing protein [Methanomicrobia archaeon]